MEPRNMQTLQHTMCGLALTTRTDGYVAADDDDDDYDDYDAYDDDDDVA